MQITRVCVLQKEQTYFPSRLFHTDFL